jgi:hypothetical protein
MPLQIERKDIMRAIFAFEAMNPLPPFTGDTSMEEGYIGNFDPARAGERPPEGERSEEYEAWLDDLEAGFDYGDDEPETTGLKEWERDDSFGTDQPGDEGDY